MKIGIFQHVPNELSGYFETFFREQKIRFDFIYLFDMNEIPRHLSATHLLLMGGPMSVTDEEKFPWLIQEKELIRRSLKNHQNLLGICLGAPLIASVYEANVHLFV